MAASDQNYRSQHALDIVFAVTSILMLVSIVMMFMQDYFREFKEEQRSFRDVEAAVAQRLALDEIPGKEEFDKAEAAVKIEQDKRDKNKDKISELKRDMAVIQPKKELSEKDFQDVKAKLESRMSFYNIEVEMHDVAAAEKLYRQELNLLVEQTKDAKAVRDGYVDQLKDLQRELDRLEGPLTEAQSAWKKVNDKFETQARVAILKQWSFGDFVRALPVLDGFASPIKIQQITVNDVTIDYNFKHVPRFDRCTTCHQGIDRPAYTKDMLRSLTKENADQEKKLQEARARLKQRKDVLAGTTDARNVPDPDRLRLSKLSEKELGEGRVNEFCVHPRLEIFVGANSKHPSEKFGCTSCHAGQGSGTDFTLASHTPNSADLKKRWEKDHQYEAIHMWDFPMLPMRFIESSCVKCHYEITDLISSNNRIEAPKLLRGYGLLKENGCFGCHEIQGRKGGRQIGPDLRLEPTPPLEELTPLERAKIEADVDNQPGNLRKVGPSLYRLAEKTNKDWTARWLRAPREFRPDTKMPHFYGLANNNAEALKGTDQKDFPDAEIQSIVHYLFEASNNHRKELAARHEDSPEVRAKDQARLLTLESQPKLSDAEKKELSDVRKRIQLRKSPLLKDLAPAGYKGDVAVGRQLFTERGCLACHSHQGTETTQGAATDPTYAPAVIGEAQFGPNLSQLTAKLGTKQGDKESARIWLMQWIMDPHVHSPRSRMPVTHLDAKQTADIAAWLLSQTAQDFGTGWEQTVVPAPDPATLKKLAQVYLVRLLPRKDMEKLLDGQELPQGQIKDLPQEEKDLAEEIVRTKDVSTSNLQRYLGKKAVSRQGCYACHDIPGFDNAKPIGVGLNEWGKKDPDRLAFEDIAAYVHDHYEVVDNLVDKDGKPVGSKKAEGKVKLPYEKFFADALKHHSREGFLHQKIQEPRSYDYNRLLAWDDRARMPQFKFARLRHKKDESAAEFEARSLKEEADAREAVMTFVLGLVAEPVPLRSISQPSGDRLAEVKGRQILDKYNCGGCHLIKAGVYDFRVSPRGQGLLDIWQGIADSGNTFHGHINWEGSNPIGPDRLQVHGTALRSPEEFDSPVADDLPEKVVMIRLTQALRFQSEKAKDLRDISASNLLQIPVNDMLYPPADVVDHEDKLAAFLREKGPYGGAFANLLVKYLVKKDVKQERFKIERGDSPNARVASPPSLIGQGERTQPEWLNQFLLDPQPVRRMSVLRMPRFNMSKDEASALVNYFIGSQRLRNPGTSLSTFSHEGGQQEGLNADEWKTKTMEYVARLKASDDPTGKNKSLYLQRLDELKPIWQQVRGEIKDRLAEAEKNLDAAGKQTNQAKEKLDKADKKDQDSLKVLHQAEEDKKKSWEAEVDRLKKSLEDASPENSQKRWEEKEAYLVDAFRLVTNKSLCVTCHQIGNLKGVGLTEGPPLILAHQRLRPGWAQRWIANPQAFVNYKSVMLTIFVKDKKEHQAIFPGSTAQQFTAARDVIMAYPIVEAMPIARYLALPLPADKTEGEKK